MKKQPIAMTMKSFCPLFSKSGGVKGQSPLWDFKGRSPLTETDKKTPHLSGEEFFLVTNSSEIQVHLAFNHTIV